MQFFMAAPSIAGGGSGKAQDLAKATEAKYPEQARCLSPIAVRDLKRALDQLTLETLDVRAQVQILGIQAQRAVLRRGRPSLLKLQRADIQNLGRRHHARILEHVPQLYLCQAVVAEEISNFAEFPPRQKPASFNLDEVLEQVSKPKAA